MYCSNNNSKILKCGFNLSLNKYYCLLIMFIHAVQCTWLGNRFVVADLLGNFQRLEKSENEQGNSYSFFHERMQH